MLLAVSIIERIAPKVGKKGDGRPALKGIRKPKEGRPEEGTLGCLTLEGTEIAEKEQPIGVQRFMSRRVIARNQGWFSGWA
jgi:hypothetical protein